MYFLFQGARLVLESSHMLFQPSWPYLGVHILEAIVQMSGLGQTPDTQE